MGKGPQFSKIPLGDDCNSYCIGDPSALWTSISGSLFPFAESVIHPLAGTVTVNM